jgi:hypothetical protein
MNQVWLRLVKLLYKPTFVFILKAWSADFSNLGGQDVYGNLSPIV